jgi:HAD superfamily hydrolase (TIGR01509 family)
LSGEDYNLSKTDPQAYEFIAKKLGKQPSEILYIDDQENNIEAARLAGLQTLHFKNNTDLLNELGQLLQ